MRVNNNSRHLFSRQVSVCCYNVNGLFNRLDGSRICKLNNPELIKVLKMILLFLLRLMPVKMISYPLMDTHVSLIVGQKCLVDCVVGLLCLLDER